MLGRFLFLGLVFVASSGRAQETIETDSERAALSLEEYLRQYLQADPTWRVSELEASIAGLATDNSRDRLTLSATATPTMRYNLYGYGSGPPLLHLGTFGLGEVGTVLQDKKGGTWSTTVNGTLYTNPNFTTGGHTAGVDSHYAAPLVRNAAGRLWAMETAWLGVEEEAKKEEAEAYRLDRCAAGINLYVATYFLQEQWDVWESLLALKEKTYQRTQREYARRMVTRLDFLAAESDWVSARQRQEELAGKRDEALASLSSYLDGQPVDFRLASPETVLEPYVFPSDEGSLKTLLNAHPRVAGLEHTSQAYKSQAAWVDRSWMPEVALVPNLGLDHFSLLPDPTGGTSSLTDLSGGLALSVDLPLIQPDRGYQGDVLDQRHTQTMLLLDEAKRDLEERSRVAEAVIVASDARLALTEEKLEILQKQIDEAGAQYSSGKLEFQDYLQHWSQFENARFERLNLLYVRWLAQVELMRALGPIPDSCGRTGL
ncbi:MAG: TolC family protein [Proteobacteria bacterium]|jgi:outer membrane protein TolC|nr:TolC family protein [Pseudomonadota bacterium]